jgi:Skp family chaperone for outer membrane proteins
MKKFGTALVALASLACLAIPYSMAANSMSMKVGYFNLNLAKTSFPEYAGAEGLRMQAESQLRRDVEEGNKALQKMQTENRPKEEIEKKAKEIQVEINIKQETLIKLVQERLQAAVSKMSQAVNEVAKEKGLDLVVDGSGIFAGGDKVLTNGDDITDAVIQKLSPKVIKPTTK